MVVLPRVGGLFRRKVLAGRDVFSDGVSFQTGCLFRLDVFSDWMSFQTEGLFRRKVFSDGMSCSDGAKDLLGGTGSPRQVL